MEALAEYRSTNLIASARAQIEQARSIDDLREIRDKAEAIRAYMKQAGESLVVQNQAAEIKVRAERRAGELLAGMDGMGEHGGDRKSSCTTKLDDLGLSKSQSHRWQTIASIPEDTFEAFIDDTASSKKEITSVGLYKLGKQLRAREPKDAPQLIHEDCTDDLATFVKAGIRFGTIYADPAWKYGNQGTRAATNDHYETMTIDEICALPVKDLVADNAHLHLWTTNAFLFEAKAVMEAWGFTYKSVMLWCKPQMGIGNYWRVSHEFLLFGLRGDAPFRDRGQMSWVVADRLEHSQKPGIFRDKVQDVSHGPYLEMFARTTAPGWSSWGNQIEGSLYGKQV